MAIVGALALGVAACGGDDEPDSSGAPAQTEQKPLKIGASLPLTGEFSEPGKAAKQGYEVWQAMVNEKGGLLGREIELVIKDDASNQNTVVSDYNALISGDKVDLLLGTFSSLLNLPASAVAERAQMLYVEPAGGNPDIFSRGFKMVFFSQQATAAHQGDTWANWLVGLPDDKKPKTAAYPTLDDPFAGPTSEGIENILKEGGIQTVYRETYTGDQKNFDAIAAAIKAKNPDLIVAGTQFEDGIGLMRALAKVNFTPKWLYQTNAPSFGDQYLEGIGAERTEGVFYAVSHSQESDTPGNPEFVAKYKEMFGERERARGRGRRLRGGPGPAGHGRGQQDGRARGPAQAGRLAARESGADDPRRAGLERGRQPEGRVPRRPVAERQAGDRAAPGRGDV